MLKRIVRNLIAVLTLMLGMNAHAADFMIDGRGFTATFPEGYCSVERGSYARDAFLYEYLGKALGRSLRIQDVGVPCGELASYRDGVEHLPARFIVVSQVGVDGKFVRFLLGHTMYAALISSFDTSDLTKFESRTTKKLEPYHDKVSALKADMLGSHDGSSWFKGSGLIENSEGLADYAMRVWGGSTLAHKYPLAVFYVSSDPAETDGSALSQVSSVLKGL